MADDERVFPDTNTLYPYYICDLLLRCDIEGLFEIRWSEDLLAELLRVPPRSGRKSAASVERLCQAIREVFPEREVPRAAYQHLIDDMPGSDPDDRVHSAAAVAGEATVLLTRDRAGFPHEPLLLWGVRATNVDEFLCELFDRYPDDLGRVLDEQVAGLVRSRLSHRQLLDALGVNAPLFADRVRAHASTS
ncbi:PIN domain-containing protein [Saccharopolyspora sp. 6M]|uniref:PIN domain-containing protein n=1 Tax=Saccharopolyspora sp. 6M TaxID=2877237 RepID=UPI001CD4921D|nr:PIN domain-containing protein [Saccharopolyspora sp. 6M]MCA1226083.1 PIN domain-containing protein [Saccharopolyspora sp. 6M]